MTISQDRVAFAVAYFVGMLTAVVLIFFAVSLEALVDSFVAQVWRPCRASLRISLPFDSRMLLPVVVLAGLQLGDYASTRFAFAHGAVELNPLVRYLGLVGSKLLVVAVGLVVAWRGRSPRPLWLVCGAYSVYIASNVRLGVIG